MSFGQKNCYLIKNVFNIFRKPFKFIGDFNDIIGIKNFLHWHNDCLTRRKLLVLAWVKIIQRQGASNDA